MARYLVGSAIALYDGSCDRTSFCTVIVIDKLAINSRFCDR
ncbi:hypothetical protein [Crinalium epipsammum]|nr:hypothetical protein [Crinalium epipsammum]